MTITAKKLMRIIFLLFCFIVISYGCNRYATPGKYINTYKPPADIYRSHLIVLKDSIRQRIKKRIYPYRLAENDSDTIIYIDTILYSPDKSKFAFFAVTEYSDNKFWENGKKTEYHYSAFCFKGHFADNFQIYDMSTINVYVLYHYFPKDDAFDDIRNFFFKELSSIRDGNGGSQWKYNVNDVRFWNGPLWYY